MRYKDEIEYRLKGLHHLIPVYKNVYHIPERLKNYDSSFFIVFNKIKQKFEVHNLENPLNTYCLTVPYPELDERTLNFTWENDIKVHGDKLFKHLDAEQERMEKDQERAQKNHLHDAAKEMQSGFAKTAWT